MLWLFPCSLLLSEFMRKEKNQKNRVVPINEQSNVSIQNNQGNPQRNHPAQRSHRSNRHQSNSGRINSNEHHTNSRHHAEQSVSYEEYSSLEDGKDPVNDSTDQALINAIPANKPTAEQMLYKKK